MSSKLAVDFAPIQLVYTRSNARFMLHPIANMLQSMAQLKVGLMYVSNTWLCSCSNNVAIKLADCLYAVISR